MRKLFKNFVPYFIRDSYSSQVEGWAILGFRFGYTCFGVAYWPNNARRFAKWQPNLVLTFWSHTGQCGQRQVFLIEAKSHRFGYRTRGDATPDLLSYNDAGWVLR